MSGRIAAAALAQRQVGESAFDSNPRRPVRGLLFLAAAPQAPPRKGIGYRLSFATDFTAMHAADTFAVITGVVRRARRRWCGRAAAPVARPSCGEAPRTPAPAGERVVARRRGDCRSGCRLGAHAPIEAGAGWRFGRAERVRSACTAACGLVRLGYRESSTALTSRVRRRRETYRYLVLRRRGPRMRRARRRRGAAVRRLRTRWGRLARRPPSARPISAGEVACLGRLRPLTTATGGVPPPVASRRDGTTRSSDDSRCIHA